MDPHDAPREGQPAREGQDPGRVLTLREAAELCDVTPKSLRSRADRGSLQTLMRDVNGQQTRCVPLAELKRAGLLPDAEVLELRDRVATLEQELASHRMLAYRTESSLAAQRDAEREARENAERAAAEQRAAATTAAAQAAQAERERLELEQNLAAAGPLRAWRLSREARRRQG